VTNWLLHSVKLVEPACATVAVPVKVVFGLAVAFEVQSVLLKSWAVGEGNVIIGNIIEEVDFLLLEHECRGDRVNRSIAPALIEEATVLVEVVKIINISRAAKPVQVANFEVGPLYLLITVCPRPC